MKDPRKSDLAMIHIAKKDLGLDDETYRQKLHGLFGVDSSSKLNPKQRAELLANFKKQGWKNHQPPQAREDVQALVKKVGALLADMKLSWNYAHGMAKRMYSRDQVQWCKPEELRGIIAALVKKQTKGKA